MTGARLTGARLTGARSRPTSLPMQP
ncbi:MAG: hypothetical protein NXI18_08775 [Alphaproteobacteria bacterium]|nr:hypothetical protein [Alphaproteobacteria bacterium]